MHPLCLKIVDTMFGEEMVNKFPLTLEGHILEIESSIADQDERPQLAKRWGVGGEYHHCIDHLPDGAPYGFVEIDMSPNVSE